MSFLVLKPNYPHESASNSLFTVKKGEILECPPGYEPSNSFQVCETHVAADQYLKLISKTKTENLPSKLRTEAEESSKLPPQATYPLFRKVSSTGGGEPAYQLFARDIHRFLSRKEGEIIADIHAVNLHRNTAERLLEYERKNFTREKIVGVLEGIVKEEEKKAEIKSEKVKEDLHA